MGKVRSSARDRDEGQNLEMALAKVDRSLLICNRAHMVGSLAVAQFPRRRWSFNFARVFPDARVSQAASCGSLIRLHLRDHGKDGGTGLSVANASTKELFPDPGIPCN